MGSEVSESKNRNYINKNRASALKSFSASKPTTNERISSDKHKEYGKVPTYISKFRNDKAEAEERLHIQLELSEMPPGTRLMSDPEKLEMIATLEISKADITNQLGRMPIANITQMHHRRIKELEDDL